MEASGKEQRRRGNGGGGGWRQHRELDSKHMLKDYVRKKNPSSARRGKENGYKPKKGAIGSQM